MSGGYEVVQQDVRDAADQLKLAADGVRDCGPDTAAAAVATALPGSRSATAATTLESRWQRRFTTWADDADGQHTTLHRNADNYDAAEHEALQRIQSYGYGPYAAQPY